LTVGSSLAWWISGVLLTGVSSGVTWTSSLALAIDVTAPDKLAEGLAFVSISLQCGLFLGTVLGGVVYQKGGYYVVWAMCFALIALDVALRLAMVEPQRPQATPTTSERSADDVCETPSTSESVEIVLSEKKIRRLPPSLLLWRSPRFTATIVGTILNATLLTSFDGALTIHLQELFGYTPLEVGLTFMALLVPIFLAPLIGRIADRHGSRLVLAANLLLGTIPLVCLRYVNHNSIGQKVLVCALLFLVGLTSAGRIGIYTSQVNHAVREFARHRPRQLDAGKAIAQAQGVWTAAYSVGCALGPVYGGLIQGKAGWATETWAVALLSVCAAVLAFLFTDGWIGRRGMVTR
jgi:MFS family permease